MAEAGRRFTIRMPDIVRFPSGQVSALHLAAGAKVTRGTPVLTVRRSGVEHVIRSPKSGNVVPLVGLGTTVAAGDPLYILSVGDVAHLPGPSAGGAPATGPALLSGPEKSELSWRPDGIIGRPWADLMTAVLKPELETVLYALGAVSVLPVLHALDWRFDFIGLSAAAIGCLLLAGFISRLYFPGRAMLMRQVARPVALSWIAIAGIAIFDRPEEVEAFRVVSAGPEIAAKQGIDRQVPVAPGGGATAKISALQSAIDAPVGDRPVTYDADVPGSMGDTAATAPVLRVRHPAIDAAPTADSDAELVTARPLPAIPSSAPSFAPALDTTGLETPPDHAPLAIASDRSIDADNDGRRPAERAAGKAARPMSGRTTDGRTAPAARASAR